MAAIISLRTFTRGSVIEADFGCGMMFVEWFFRDAKAIFASLCPFEAKFSHYCINSPFFAARGLMNPGKRPIP